MPDITLLLEATARGDARSSDQLFKLVYQDLKRLAAHRLKREHPGQTLQPTALVHEAYLRLLGAREGQGEERKRWDGEQHFFAAAAEAMRRILVESARRKKRQKHGGEFQRVALEPNNIAEPERAAEVLILDEALTHLAQVEPHLAELVRLRFFAGLSIKESAELLGIAPRTADAHWAYARAWLLAEMNKGTQ